MRKLSVSKIHELLDELERRKFVLKSFPLSMRPPDFKQQIEKLDSKIGRLLSEMKGLGYVD